MKIKRSQIKNILKEFYSEDVEEYLRTNAAEYHKDSSLDSGGIRMLLMDDFMDNIGHSEDISDYQDLIDKLASGEITESKMKTSRRKIIELVRETAGEMRSREAIAGAQSMRADGTSFEGWITELLDYLEDKTNQQWSEEMLSDDWNFYDEWIEGADPTSIAAEYLADSYEYMRENKMRVTKRQLRRVIREEKRKILREGLTQEENLANAIQDYVIALSDYIDHDDIEDFKPDVMGQVDAWFENQANAAEWDEADQDYANQAYIEQHGNPYDENY